MSETFGSQYTSAGKQEYPIDEAIDSNCTVRITVRFSGEYRDGSDLSWCIQGNRQGG
jgi:hypothetical protein